MSKMDSNIRFMRSERLERKRDEETLRQKILKKLERRYQCPLLIDQSVVSQIDQQNYLTILAMPAQEI